MEQTDPPFHTIFFRVLAILGLSLATVVGSCVLMYHVYDGGDSASMIGILYVLALIFGWPIMAAIWSLVLGAVRRRSCGSGATAAIVGGCLVGLSGVLALSPSIVIWWEHL